MAQRNDKYNFVLYVPEVKHREFRVTEAGTVVLELDVNPAKRLMGKLAAKEPVSDIEFDSLSSSAWLAIDGSRSILDIARLQADKSGDDIDESARRVAQFMKYVLKRGWIRLGEAKPASAE